MEAKYFLNARLEILEARSPTLPLLIDSKFNSSIESDPLPRATKNMASINAFSGVAIKNPSDFW